MKLKITGEHGFKFKAENPDESLSNYFVGKMEEAYRQELVNFFREVVVSMRKLKEGETITVKSIPLIVTLSKKKEK